MTTRKIVLKKVKVGTPIKTVTAGSFGINNLGGVNTSGRTSGSLLAFNQSSGNFEPVTLTGDSNHFLTFDSSSTPDTLQINFTNDSISGSLIPKLDSAFDLGSSTKKWKDLFLSGSTITLGDLTIKSTGGGIEVKDSDGNTLLQNIKYITVNGDTDILAYDSSTSTFTFNDSDIARTDEIETFHKAIKVTDSAEITSNLTVGGNLTVSGDLSYDDVSADSATFSGSVAIGNNLTADSSTINKIANTTLTGQNATFDSATIGNLAVTNLVISSGDSAFFSKVGVGDLEVDSANIDRLTLDSAQVRQLSTGFINADSAFMDSATITTIATGSINADQQFTDSATITNLANSVLTAKVITGDSATIGNVAVTTQLTGNQANFDSVASNTLHANSLSVDSGDIRQLSVDFINADSAFLDSATITNLSTSQITLSQTTIDSATINTLNADSSDIRQFSTEFINFDSAFGDSATITNIANTQLTGSQATFDSATITNLNVDSSDIRQLSTEFINADSAFIDSATIGNIAITNAVISSGDSATFTSLANSTFTGKVITGTNVAFDSARIGSIGIGGTDITTSGKIYYANVFSGLGDLPDASSHHGMFAHVHATGGGYFAHAGAWHRLIDSSTTAIQRVRALLSDSATINNLAAGTINVDNINIGDSATFTNLASTQLTVDNATLDSSAHNTLHANKLTADSGDIRQLSVDFINFDSAFGDSATITNIANSVLTAKAITGTSATIDSATIGNIAITNAVISSGDSATITNIASSQLTIDNASFDSVAANTIHVSALTNDSATITNIANTQFTGSQATIDSADIGNLRTTGVLQTDSVNTTQIEFLTNVTNVPAHKEGRIFYDDSNKTIGFYSDVDGLVHEVGIEEHQRVYNNTGSTIAKGKPVYFSGNYTGGAVDVPTVALADATDTAKYNAQGLTAVAIPNNSYGYIQTSGQLSGLDTSGLSAGQKVFVGLGSGLLSNSTPLYPNYPICLGWCVSSNASTGVILLNRQAHTIDSLRVVTSGHIGSNLQIDGNLTVLGSTTSVSSADLTAGTPMFRLNEGNAIGEAGTTFSGTGLDDAFYSGFFTGTTNQNYYVRIDGVGTGAGGVDTFEVAFGADSTFSSPVLTKQVITGSAQMIHSTDNISINFASTTGHDSGARWAGTAGPINVDTGFFSNRNTGGSGVGFTYVGIYYDVSDDKWKLIDEYDSNPSGSINEADASYSLGTLKLDTLEGNVTGNVTGNVSGTAATVTGAAQSNITSVGTLTGLTIGGDLTLDSAGAVVYDKSEQALTFGDNHKAKFGTGGDLQIYHSGAESRIDENGVGNLKINANNLEIYNSASSEAKAKFNTDGAVELYHDNSKKFETTASGINVTGTVDADGLTVNTGTTNTVATFTSTDAGAAIQLTDPTGSSKLETSGANLRVSVDDDGAVASSAIQFRVDGSTKATINDGGLLDVDGGITVDNITIDGTEIDLSSGDLTLDVAGEIILDADGDNIYMKAGGGNQSSFSFINGDVYLGVETQDKDLIIRGNDGGSTITALTLDMSEAGKATFNDMVVAPKADIDSADIRQLTTEFIHGDSAVFDSATITTLAVGTLNIDNINIGDSATFTNVAVSTALNTNSLIVDDITINSSTISDAGTITIDANHIDLDADGGNITFKDGGTEIGQFQLNDTNHFKIGSKVSDADIRFFGNDGGSTITPLILDMSEGGAATFNNTVTLSDELAVNGTGTAQIKINGATGNESVLRFYDGGSESWMLRQTNADNILSFRRNSTNHVSLSASGDVSMAGTLSVGNLNVDSADIIKIARDNLSTANSSALTYDSAAGQFGLNANHVMALIKTVDSNGSGLNADTLEGQAGSHYRINVYNASGTLLN